MKFNLTQEQAGGAGGTDFSGRRHSGQSSQREAELATSDAERTGVDADASSSIHWCGQGPNVISRISSLASLILESPLSPGKSILRVEFISPESPPTQEEVLNNCRNLRRQSKSRPGHGPTRPLVVA
jgi:hypothetical protein